MATTQYKCTNFANCDKALQREVIEIEDGEEKICPACGELVEPVKKKTGDPVRGLPKWALPAAALFCAVGLALWLFFPPKKPVIVPVNSTNGIVSPPVVKPVPDEPCTDGQLAANIKDRLAHDENLKSDPIQVDVTNKTVILSGVVENDMARNYAAELVHRTGCQIVSVVNDLKMGAPDDKITAEIKHAFAKNADLKSQQIQTEVSHGNVVLSGFVCESLARTVAADVASHVNGAATITNNLQVHACAKEAPVERVVTGVHRGLGGLWTGTYNTCAQGSATVRMKITDPAPDDITATIEIAVPAAAPGTFVAHGVLNTMNSFMTLQFSGWQNQPLGMSMGNIGGYVTYRNQKPEAFAGVIRSPGCGQINLTRQ